ELLDPAGIEDVLEHRDGTAVDIGQGLGVHGDHGPSPDGAQLAGELRAPAAPAPGGGPGPGLAGLRGTPTNPPRTVASHPTTNSTVLPASNPTRSPTSRPSSASPACSPATSR